MQDALGAWNMDSHTVLSCSHLASPQSPLHAGLGMAMGRVSWISPEAWTQSRPQAPERVCIPHEYSCAEGTGVALTANCKTPRLVKKEISKERKKNFYSFEPEALHFYFAVGLKNYLTVLAPIHCMGVQCFLPLSL